MQEETNKYVGKKNKYKDIIEYYDYISKKYYDIDKLNYIGIIITSSIIILVNIKLFSGFNYSYYYVAQNYLYFTVMYITLLVNYLINYTIV